VRTSEVVALLDLLTSRGTVAWQVRGSTDTGARLVVDTSGVDSAMRLLVSRGFVATEVELPSHVELAHARHGRVVLLPCQFAADGAATWRGHDGPVRVSAEEFDSLEAVPRRVVLEVHIPGIDPDIDDRGAAEQQT
jgi:hypothetical protein